MRARCDTGILHGWIFVSSVSGYAVVSPRRRSTALDRSEGGQQTDRRVSLVEAREGVKIQEIAQSQRGTLVEHVRTASIYVCRIQFGGCAGLGHQRFLGRLRDAAS